MKVNSVNSSYGINKIKRENAYDNVNISANYSTNSLEELRSCNVQFCGNFIQSLKSKIVSGRETEKLHRAVREKAADVGIKFDFSNFETKYHWKLANYLLNHEIINNPDVKDEMRSIMLITRYENGNGPIDMYATKAKADTVKDYVDFIVSHPVYEHPNVKAVLGKMISSATIVPSKINEYKFMADYCAKHPESLNNIDDVFSNLVLREGYNSYKLFGFAWGVEIDDWDEFVKTEDYKQSKYYREYDSDYQDDNPETITLDSILDRLSLTRHSELSDDEVDYLANYMGLQDPSVLSKLHKPEYKNLYRNLCKKYHPDANPNNSDAETIFKIINLLNIHKD